MGKTIIPNKLNHKPQAHARGVQRKKRLPVKIFCGKKDQLWKPVEEQ